MLFNILLIANVLIYSPLHLITSINKLRTIIASKLVPCLNHDKYLPLTLVI